MKSKVKSQNLQMARIICVFEFVAVQRLCLVFRFWIETELSQIHENVIKDFLYSPRVVLLFYGEQNIFSRLRFYLINCVQSCNRRCNRKSLTYPLC